MAEYLSPGIYVEEYDSSPRSIEGVGTSTAGFVGIAEKGPTTGVPQLVTSFADYLRQYGGYLSAHTHGDYRFLPYTVEQFFMNGGTRCYISRVIPTDAKAATGRQGILSFTAANEGKWGNRVTIAITGTSKRKLQIVESVSDTVFKAKSVVGFKEGDIVTLGEEVNRIVTILENNVTFENAFSSDPVDDALVPKTWVYSAELDIAVQSDGYVENYRSVDLNPDSVDYVLRRLAGSTIVEVDAKPLTDIMLPIAQIFDEDTDKGIIPLSGGADGTIAAANAGTFIGVDNGPGKRTGIESFKENNIVSLIAVPGVTIPEVLVALTTHCENEKNRFAVIDVPVDTVKTDEIAEYREIIDSSYAAIYHPWVQVYDHLAQAPAYVPPSGTVLGVYSRTDIERGVHKAPANEIVRSTGLSTNYTSKEQDILNPIGVNLIRALPGQGIRVWGARTASSDSRFKYVNVRRLFIFVEESIKNSTNWVVFEPNGADLWNRVQMTISSFLEGLYSGGMLAGDTSDQAYFVDIGPTTMTRDDIENGRLICNVGIAPVKPAEFVIFRVTQFTAEAGGSDGGGGGEE
ncbi:MAG: phage tail sheath subtilisin-like domain-containing protein [Clostridiales Family XIII bacterium]|jgi:phage tail sheath protein FI|nr:phage tail sheath subtilisin-like domain-containing protein [Clostridiales Family XIII bacterium]